uniref:Uncharacterized protein n=1 Tax=Arundo donax TaxID=35708 RepID=A0A0A9F2F4_ARUDO
MATPPQHLARLLASPLALCPRLGLPACLSVCCSLAASPFFCLLFNRSLLSGLPRRTGKNSPLHSLPRPFSVRFRRSRSAGWRQSDCSGTIL